MNEKLKGFAKDSVFYALGDWLNKLSGLILVPILSRLFLPSQYGIIDLLNVSYMFLQIMVGLNIDSGMQRYYYLREGEHRKTMISSTMLFRLCFSCMIAFVITSFSKDISQLAFNTGSYHNAIFLLALCIPMDDLNDQFMLYLRLDRKPIKFSVFNTVPVILQILITYTLISKWGYGIDGVFLARLITSTSVTTILMLNGRQHYTNKLGAQDAYGLIKFSLPGLPATIQANVMNLLPRYALAYYSTLTAVGLFGTADKIAKTVEMFKTSFNRAWNPFAYANAGKVDEKYLYEKVFKLFAFCLIFIVVMLAVFARDLISILTPPMYHSAAAFVAGIGFSYALRGLTLIFSTCLYTANKVAQTSFMATIQLVTFLACAVILVPLYQTAGLVLSLDAAAIVYFVCYARTAKRYYAFKFSGYRVLVTSALGMATVLCAKYTGFIFSSTSMMFNSVINAVLLGVFVWGSYCVLLTKEERDAFIVAVKSRSTNKMPV